jgi:prepilin-type N-terminal cleavage/methylation domain-containing protein
MPERTVNSKRGGFSLVEIVIVLTVMGVLAGLSIGYVVSARPNAQLQRGELVLTSALSKARNLAISEETQVRVTFVESTGTINIGRNDGTGWTTVASETLPEGVGFKSGGNTFASATVTFNTRGTLVSGGALALINDNSEYTTFTGNLSTGRFNLGGGHLR